jgi:hypothetical protein
MQEKFWGGTGGVWGRHKQSIFEIVPYVWAPLIVAIHYKFKLAPDSLWEGA